MDTLGVMHVVDSLDLGGTESVAVNLANRLPRQRFRSYLCSTRPSTSGTDLRTSLQGDVCHLPLNRKSRFDFSAARAFRTFIGEKDIRILHVHGSSLFFSRFAALSGRMSEVRTIWHDHYGRCELNDRPASLYRIAIAGAGGVIAVNQQLREWACRELHVPAKRVWYVPNFVLPAEGAASSQELPGVPGQRIVCIANLRPQKDHLNLIRAMSIVQKECPPAHLLLVGGESDPAHGQALRDEVARLHLENNISFLGQVERASSILSACDIGVLSSVSEGLPLSLLEYGWANLPSVATSVGQCAQVLNNGDAGILVEPQDSGKLAAALLRLLQSSEERANYGKRFGAFVRKEFHPETILDQICGIYELVVSGN